MIHKVVICGLKRANTYVPEFDLRQMIGRCGRSYDSLETGEVTLLVQDSERDYADRIIYGTMPTVDSSLTDIRKIAFHVLPEMFHNEVKDEHTFNKWYGRSLASSQGKNIKADDVFEYLKQCETLDDKLNVTNLGKLSVKFYYPPERVYILKQRFEQVAQTGISENTCAIAWSLADKAMYVNSFEDDEAFDEFEHECDKHDLSFEGDDEKTGAFAVFCGFKNYMIPQVRNDYMKVVEDAGRITSILSVMNKIYGWGVAKSNFIVYQIMIQKKVEFPKAKFMFDSKIKIRTIVDAIFELGYKTFSDFNKDKKKLERTEPHLIKRIDALREKKCQS